MSAFKRLFSSDYSISPYVANKDWTLTNLNKSIGFKNSKDETEKILYDTINHMFFQQYSDFRLSKLSLLQTGNYESASEVRGINFYNKNNNVDGLLSDKFTLLQIPKNTYHSKI